SQHAMTRAKRIEYSHLDFLVTVERHEELVARARIHVVEQQTHMHAAISRMQQLLNKQAAAGIVAPNVILQIDAADRGPRACRSDRERLGALRQQPRTAFSGMLCDLRSKQPVQ